MCALFQKTYSKNKRIAEKALSRITNDDALAKVVLDERALIDIRCSALERLTDDVVVVQLLSEFSIGDVYMRYLWECSVLMIQSQAAIEAMKEYALRDDKLDYCLWKGVGIDYLRRTGDRECLLQAVKCLSRYTASDSGEWSLIVKDIIRLKQMGEDTVMLADCLYDWCATKAELYMPELFSVELIQKHSDDVGWIKQMRDIAPEDMVRQAFKNRPDEAEKLALYQIPDGITYNSKCDFGIHDYVLDHHETEENHEDYYHPDTRYYYRCSRCGKIRTKIVDGYGREYWSGE